MKTKILRSVFGKVRSTENFRGSGLKVLAIGLAATLSLTATQAQAAVTYMPHEQRWDKKPDFAVLEAKHPISRADLERMTVADLRRLNQEQLEQLFARLTSGPIPNGDFQGEVVVLPEGLADRVSTVLGVPSNTITRGLLESFVGMFWTGKTFYKEQGLLMNKVDLLPAMPQLINLISRSFLGAELPRNRIERGAAGLRTRYRIFPAALYCGQSLIDSRRESVVIDYAYNDKFTSEYSPEVDFLANRNGFKIRDEIRMVNPNLYLGRAYLNRIFVLNFVLTRNVRPGPSDWQDECWSGTQERR